MKTKPVCLQRGVLWGSVLVLAGQPQHVPVTWRNSLSESRCERSGYTTALIGSLYEEQVDTGCLALPLNQGGTSLGNTRLSGDKGRGIILETSTPRAPFFTSRILEATFYFLAEN